MSSPDPVQQHRDASDADRAGISTRVAVLTVSDTRSRSDDASGDAIIRAIEGGGFTVVDRTLVRDDPPAIEAAFRQWIARDDVDVVISTGGTGIARRDNTIRIVRGLLSAELEGFGELFRMLSYEQIGSAAMLSRAVGGLAVTDERAGGDTFIFALPGSPKAVELAMSRLLVPELAHLIWQRR